LKTVKNSQPSKKKRGPKSGTGYPYYNMEDSVEVAKLVHERGGGSCSPAQLASFLDYSGTNSGTYLTRVASAKMFGLIVAQQGVISVTERARGIFAPVMPDDCKKAKVDAFLSVPLFKAIFDKFNGTYLPPTVGLRSLLENQFQIVRARVTPAQRVLMESAEYAGFFDTHGDQTRLIEPAMGATPAQQNNTPEIKQEKTKIETPERSKGGGESRGPPTGIHTAIIGLLRELPSPGPWKKSQKEGFMQAFKSTIDFIYPEEKEGES